MLRPQPDSLSSGSFHHRPWTLAEAVGADAGMLPVCPAKFLGELVAVAPSGFSDRTPPGSAPWFHTAAPSAKVIVPPFAKKNPLGTT